MTDRELARWALDHGIPALKHVDEWFRRLRSDHDEKLGHGFKEACDNWDSISQEPLDLTPVMNALQAVQVEQKTE